MTTRHITEANPTTVAERDSRPRPRIFLAPMAGYRPESPEGAWLDADVGWAALEDAAAATLGGPADEYVIHAHENFAGLDLGPATPLRTVADIARGVRDHGAAFVHWTRLLGENTDLLDEFSSSYFGYWPTPGTWAAEFMKDLGLGHELAHLTPGFQPYLYVDYEGFARDMRLHGELAWQEADGGVHLFLAPWRLGDHCGAPDERGTEAPAVGNRQETA